MTCTDCVHVATTRCDRHRETIDDGDSSSKDRAHATIHAYVGIISRFDTKRYYIYLSAFLNSFYHGIVFIPITDDLHSL